MKGEKKERWMELERIRQFLEVMDVPRESEQKTPKTPENSES